jgi:hypothetical protein
MALPLLSGRQAGKDGRLSRAGPSRDQTVLRAGFKSCDNAAITIAGIDLAHRINERLFSLAPADRVAFGR